MPASGTITRWIHQLKSGERAAVQELWERYFQRLTGLARQMLKGAPRGKADEEDVALSAFKSFCLRAEQGQFPRLNDRDDLWQLLVLLAARKASNLKKQERRQKRGGGRVLHESALPDGDPAGEGPAFTRLIGQEPDPAFAAQVADECRRLLERLDGAEQRSIALWKMEGCSNSDIAGRLGCAESTVERKLRLIRTIWQQERPS